jgi:hypothetical protein
MKQHAWIMTTAFAVACGSSSQGPAPTLVQQAGVATYAGALELCIARAKLTDAGLASYQTCAHQADVTFGRIDGGTK